MGTLLWESFGLGGTQGPCGPACENASQVEGKLKKGDGSLRSAPPWLPLEVRPTWGGAGEGWSTCCPSASVTALDWMTVDIWVVADLEGGAGGAWTSFYFT